MSNMDYDVTFLILVLLSLRELDNSRLKSLSPKIICEIEKPAFTALDGQFLGSYVPTSTWSDLGSANGDKFNMTVSQSLT
ncbi:hypothetical protein PoB_000843600 [Plakobranchus ocellatus]|uniref:Uncharacterized protein n=1 Tax=Plakobranchus ocellatus TaxID=259542 RepID=A0AAV3YFG1_9GAST|nr:hypothetical protein PoB_000843600 [Plakobranchus ocellatus]